MTQEEISRIDKIIKKVFVISALVYGLFIFCVFYFLGKALTPTQLLLIIIFAPMLVGGIVLGICKLKHPPVLDETPDQELEAEVEETDKNED